MPIAAATPTGIYQVGAYRRLAFFSFANGPPVPMDLNAFSAYGFDEVLLFWRLVTENGGLLPGSSLTMRLIGLSGVVPFQTPEVNFRQDEPQRFQVDSADTLFPRLTAANLTPAPEPEDVFEIYVAGASPRRFQARP